MALFIINTTCLDDHALKGYSEQKHIVIQNDYITDVRESLPQITANDKVIDGKNLFVIPGLVNAHSHSTESLLKGTTEKMNLEEWSVAMPRSPLMPRSPEDYYHATLLNAMDAILSGTTHILDHVWMLPHIQSDHLNAVMQAYVDIGMRATVVPLINDTDTIVKEALKQFPELRSTVQNRTIHAPPTAHSQLTILDTFLTTWLHKSATVTCGIGPSAVQWCTPHLFSALHERARHYALPFHLHAVETPAQKEITTRQLGMSSIQWLHKRHALGPLTSLAHGIWMDEPHDWDILQETETTLVHNPASNLKLGSGLAPIMSWRRHGINIALGSDGSASSDNQNMFRIMNLTALIHTLSHANPTEWPQSHEIVTWATRTANRALGYNDASVKKGRIAPGYLADLVLIDRLHPAWVPFNNPLVHLVHVETGSAIHGVIIGGQVVAQNHHISTVPESGFLSCLNEATSHRTDAPIPPSVDSQVMGRLGQEFRRP